VTSMDRFPTETAGLPAARRADVVELAEGERFELRIAPVTKRIGDATVRMLAYNGSIPGPTLRVREGSEVDVDIENQGDHDTTVHWHGLRLENRYDGTHETQALIPVGGRFTARVAFPDPGAYWYHPHARGLRPGARPLRQRARGAGRSRVLAAGESRARADA
jgi:FtsP/CotA-like multicopper oxidase with cupredoxin domain